MGFKIMNVMHRHTISTSLIFNAIQITVLRGWNFYLYSRIHSKNAFVF